jgi:hypothetical protein
VQHESKESLGLERVKKWLYAKGLDERSSGSVLYGSYYGHGPANPMEDVPGPKEKCPPYEFYRFQRHTPESCWLMASVSFTGLTRSRRNLRKSSTVVQPAWCRWSFAASALTVTNHAIVTVAMREQISEEERPIDAHRHLYLGLQQHDNPWSKMRGERGFWAAGLGLTKISERHAPRLLFVGCSADQAIGRTGVVALAKLMQRAGEDFVILGDQENAAGCMLMTLDLVASTNVCTKKPWTQS